MRGRVTPKVQRSQFHTLVEAQPHNEQGIDLVAVASVVVPRR
jgi:hypothetical protein